MDVNYPDQIVSLFATGMVITAVMEARRTGKGCFLDFSQREVASFTIGEEILAAACRSRPSACAAAATAKRAWRSRTPIAAATAAGSPSRSPRRIPTSRPGARRRTVPRRSPACWPRASPAAPCNDGADLLRDKALAGVTLVRDERGGLVKGLPYRLDGEASRSSAPHPISDSTPQRYCASCWATTTPNWTRSPTAGVTSTTPTVGDV